MRYGPELDLDVQRVRGTRATCFLLAGAGIVFIVPSAILGEPLIVLALTAFFSLIGGGAGLSVRTSNYKFINRGMTIVGLGLMQALVVDSPHFGLATMAVVCLIHTLYVEDKPIYRSVFLTWTAVIFFLAVVGHEPISSIFPAQEIYRQYVVVHIILATGLSAALLGVHGEFNRNLLFEVQRHTVRLAKNVDQLRTHTQVREERQRALQQVQAKIERSLTEETLTQNRVAAAREQLEQFAYAASHDLKEPVRTIRSFVEVTQRRLPQSLAGDARLAEDFGFIVNSANAMHAVLEKLLLYSRMGRQTEAASALSVSQLWEAAVITAKHNGKFPDAEIEAVIEPDLHVQLPASQARVLFAELLANALTFHDGSQARRIVCHGMRCPETGRAVIQISDNGIGIAPEYTKQVFGLFKRLHPREVYPGSGLGLALVMRIIESAPGAEVSIESAVDEGTTVRVEI